MLIYGKNSHSVTELCQLTSINYVLAIALIKTTAKIAITTLSNISIVH